MARRRGMSSYRKGLDLASSQRASTGASGRATSSSHGVKRGGYKGGLLLTATIDQGERHVSGARVAGRVKVHGKAVTSVYRTPKSTHGQSGSGAVGAV